MKTLHLSPTPADLQTAAGILRSGGIAAFPTETVYGLGANALDEAAVRKIFAAKGRPADNPLIVHVTDIEQAASVWQEITPTARMLAERFWPGPLTMILPRKDCVPDVTTAGLHTVGVRCPDHPVALELIRRAGLPIAAPSANRSGKPSPTEFSHLVRDLEGRADALIDGGSCRIGVESTVLDLTSDPPRLLRPGGVTLPMLQEVLGQVLVDDAILGELAPNAKVRSPGMKYRHYAPTAPVTILRGDTADAVRFVLRQTEKGKRCAVLCYDEEEAAFSSFPLLCYGSKSDPLSLSHHLFAALRTLDDWELDAIYARCPEGDVNLLAVENRLKKAAGFHTVSLTAPCVVGLTGGSGAGKTAVLQRLCEKGAFCIDADALYHRLLRDCAELREELRARFPTCVSDGGVDRAVLSQIVFTDPDALADLNAITHRHVLSAVRDAFSHTDARIAVLDAPTLFESGFDRECAWLVAVTAPYETRLARILQRDGMTPERAQARLRSQKSDDFFTGHCDRVLENAGDLAALHAQVDRLWNELTN